MDGWSVCYLMIHQLIWSYHTVCDEGPVSMAEQSKTCTVYDRLNIGIAGSNPASGMDVCPCVSVLCCPVSVEALRRADPPSKESYQNVSICRLRSPLG
jgi:hypothetical protein